MIERVVTYVVQAVLAWLCICLNPILIFIGAIVAWLVA